MWINVEDRLPDNSTPVLVAILEHDVYLYLVATFEKGKWHVYEDSINIEVDSSCNYQMWENGDSIYPCRLWVNGTVVKWMVIPG